MGCLQVNLALYFVFFIVLTVLVIAGTTAVGKTDLSIQLAKLLGGEIVSADSVQVRGCDLINIIINNNK